MNKPILWYDTNCNLCQRYVRMTRWFDKNDHVHYQSIYEKEPTPEVDSIIFTLAEQDSIRSDAVLAHWSHIGGFLAFVAWWGRWLPLSWRDWLYDVVARNRYQWFGTCDCKS